MRAEGTAVSTVLLATFITGNGANIQGQCVQQTKKNQPECATSKRIEKDTIHIFFFLALGCLWHLSEWLIKAELRSIVLERLNGLLSNA